MCDVKFDVRCSLSLSPLRKAVVLRVLSMQIIVRGLGAVRKVFIVVFVLMSNYGRIHDIDLMLKVEMSARKRGLGSAVLSLAVLTSVGSVRGYLLGFLVRFGRGDS
jgi:hypothetical protein